MNFFRKIVGFTLAEVLITLAIIGVVAALTIPTLVKSYQKQAVVTKLQKSYTMIYQSIKLSEAENSSSNTWVYPADNSNGAETLTWFNTYLAPFMKYTKSELGTLSAANDCVNVYLQDGTELRFWYYNVMHIWVLLEPNKTEIGGKNSFVFMLYPTYPQKAFVAYNYYASDGTRSFWKDDATHGCNKSATNTAKAYCVGLIMYDGWQIKSDYPYFN